jgi:hypothetical protein
MKSRSPNTGSCGIIFWVMVQARTEEDLEGRRIRRGPPAPIRPVFASPHRCRFAAALCAAPRRTTAASQHRRRISAASLPYCIAAPHHGVAAAAAPLVPRRTGAPHCRSAPHRSMGATPPIASASIPLRRRTIAHRSTTAASQSHHFRTASPRRKMVWPHRWCRAAPPYRTVVPLPSRTVAAPPHRSKI